MPLYDYRCRACSKVTEVRHGFREPFEGTCPDCGGALARVFNPAGIVFKGSGFYVNDSRKPSAPEGGSSSSSSSASSNGDGAAKKSEPSSSAASTTTPSSNASSGDSGPKKSESSAA